MAGEPSSPRKDRLAALRTLAETVLSKTDDEKGHVDWIGRSEVMDVIALLTFSNRPRAGDQLFDVASASLSSAAATSRVEISPTLPWVAEEESKADELTIVERGQIFSAWSEKRRRLREG